MNLADEIRDISMKWIWGGVFIIIAFFGVGLTPWDVIAHLIANKGMGEEGIGLVSFVAGYTLPLTAGFGIIALFVLTKNPNQSLIPFHAIVAAGILYLAGWVAAHLGLGLLPQYSRFTSEAVRPPLGPLFFVLQGYFNTYGWSLMICALAISLSLARN